MDTRELGSFGEQQASMFLRKKGYSIAAVNYSCRIGEIDIIARKDNIIAFVEVKLRKSDYFGSGMEYVTKAKQKRIIRTAMYYMQHKSQELQPRFDIIEIYAPNGKDGAVTIDHLEDAFQCDYTL